MLTFLCIRHTSHVSPVVVAKQDEHVVGNAHTLIVIVEHFLIQCPHLRCLAGWFSSYLLDDFPLVFHDALKQFGISILTHRLVAVASHADGYDVVGAFHALNAFTEELVEFLLVCLIVPCTPIFSFSSIFLMVASHRFMM